MHLFNRHRSEADSAQPVSPSPQITTTSVGKGPLKGTVAATPLTPRTSLEAQVEPAAASDSTATQGNVNTGIVTTAKQEQLPSCTISAQDFRKDESRSTTLQNVPDNDIAPQLVPSPNAGRILAPPVDVIRVNDPAVLGTAPTPLERTMTTDGPPTSPAPAQQDSMNPQLTSTTRRLTLTPQQGDTTTESAISRTRGAASTQPSAAAMQVAPSVGTLAGPVTAAAEQKPSGSLWYSERTPRWNDAVNMWKAENPKGCDELETMTAGVMKSTIQRADILSLFQPASESSKQIIARSKRWQPTLAALRGIGMSVAALDPHKIAPIICASVFFSIDVSNPSSPRTQLTKADSF